MKALKPIEYNFPWTKEKCGKGPRSGSVWKPTYAIYLSVLALLLGAIAIFSPTYSAEVGRLKMISTFVLFILGVGVLFALINIVVIEPLASFQKRLIRTHVSKEALQTIAGIRVIEGFIFATHRSDRVLDVIFLRFRRRREGEGNLFRDFSVFGYFLFAVYCPKALADSKCLPQG